MDAADLKYEIVTKLKNDGLTRHKVYSPEALKVLSAEPVKTAWGWDHGRPIFNRLPMIGEAYQKAYNSDQAEVYLDPTVPIATGPGTLQVLKYQRDWRILDIEGGTITWKHGELETSRLLVDITALDGGRGLQNGEYQVGYRLFLEEGTKNDFALADNEEALASTIEIVHDASGETTLHREPYALSDNLNESWWPNAYYSAEGYLVGTHYTFDFQEPLRTEKFFLNGDEGKIGANGAHYASDNAIIWYKRSQIVPDGKGWEFDAQGEDARYHRFFFWDGDVSINTINYTGQAYVRDNRSLIPVTSAEPFIESMYDAIEGDYILLARFTVRNGVVDQVDDLRRVTYEKYQPVADWLTKFGDEQLRCRFDDVLEYNTRFMDPVTADYHFYNEMDDSNCWGLGEITVADVESVPKINYPTEVGLFEPNVSANMIEYVTYPEENGDLVTPPYAQVTLQDWSLDNGIY